MTNPRFNKCLFALLLLSTSSVYSQKYPRVRYIYEYMSPFYDAHAIVKQKGGVYSILNAKTGLPSGLFEDIMSFREKCISGHSRVEDNCVVVPAKRFGKWGFVSTDAYTYVDFRFDEVDNFEEGMAAVKLDGKWGFIKGKGDPVVPVIYEDVADFSDGLAAVMKNEKWGFVDKTGKEVIPLMYEQVGNFSEGLAPVLIDEKIGFINKKNKLVIPARFDDVLGFEYDNAPVMIDDLWGLIDTTGKLVVQPTFDDISEAQYFGRAVKKDDRYGAISTDGELVIPVKYDDIYSDNNDNFIVELDSKLGIFDCYGRKIVPIKYDWIEPLKGDRYAVMIGQRGTGNRAAAKQKWGFLDKNGKVIVEPKYNKVENFDKELVAVANVTYDQKYLEYQQTEVYYIDLNGNRVRKAETLEKQWFIQVPTFAEVALGHARDRRILLLDE